MPPAPMAARISYGPIRAPAERDMGRPRALWHRDRDGAGLFRRASHHSALFRHPGPSWFGGRLTTNSHVLLGTARGREWHDELGPTQPQSTVAVFVSNRLAGPCRNMRKYAWPQ